jgi:hypothetical protein
VIRPLPTVTLALAAALGCSRPLPEEGTAAEVLYRERCGTCHRAYPPSVLKFPVWEMVLPRMENRMRELRQPPLSAEERTAIVDYLKRNS